MVSTQDIRYKLTKKIQAIPITESLFLLLLLMQGVAWGQAGPVRLQGSGGTITEINVSGTYYEVHTYTGSSTFTPPSGATSVEYLVVAGGGGGGNSTDRTGGGGGAGGVLNGLSYAVTVQGYSVTVGAGGAANTSGSNSVFGTLTAIGGGRGGQSTNLATTGGSGGGAYHNNSDSGKAGTTGQGSAGGNGYDNGSSQFGAGGGGGQSQAGATGVSGQAGKGGNGYTSSISGNSLVYAGGGGGGYERTSGSSGLGGAGGTGGGGAGAYSASNTSSVNGTSGSANTGGGGGGAAGSSSGVGGAGGSGIVIIRYKAPTLQITTQPSSTISCGRNFLQPPVVRLLDGNGSAVAGVTVTAAIETGTGGALYNNQAVTDANGYATFTNLQITGSVGNTYTLNFTVPGSTGKVISNTITLTITNPPATTGATVCTGTVATLSASGAVSGDKYKWYDASNGGNLLKTSTNNTDNTYTTTTLTITTNYWVSILNAAGCESARTQVTATVSKPVATVTNQTNITCYSGIDGTITVSASGGTAPYSYTKNDGANWTLVPATDPPFTFQFTGLVANQPYRIKVKDSNGCLSE
jgi:hypothetical protein